MASAATGGGSVTVLTVPRLELFRCQTRWCRSILGERQAGGVRWFCWVSVDRAGAVVATCPVCRAERVWRPKGERYVWA